MTIMEALERAKRLQKGRNGLSVEPTVIAAPSDTGMLKVLHDGVSVEIAERVEPPEPFCNLQIDAAACAENRLLCTDDQVAKEKRGAAAYRMLRGRLLHRARSGNWTCLGITSPGPGEGKTVTILNLALAVAREKQRPVYLLDLDMRSPRVMRYLGVRPPVELPRYFTEPLQCSDVICQLDIENLYVAGAIEPVTDASELLASVRLDELLSAVRRRSPDALVLLDLPPVLSTDEALVVAPRIDAMFLVIAEGITRRDGLSKAMQMLGDFNVAGTIINRSGDVAGNDSYYY